MSEFDETMTPTNEVDTEAVETQSAETPTKDPVEALTDELMKASRLLRQRRRTLRDEGRAAEERATARLRALKLLALKPGMDQRELAELLGERVRVVDEAMAELEEQGLVTRTAPEEPDMRAITVELTDAGATAIEAGALAVEVPTLAPGFEEEDLASLTTLLAQLNAAFEALGLHDDDRGSAGRREGRDNFRGGRADRGGFRGGRDGRENHGNKGNYHAPGHDGTRHTQSARYEKSERRSFGPHNRKGFGKNNRQGN